MLPPEALVVPRDVRNMPAVRRSVPLDAPLKTRTAPRDGRAKRLGGPAEAALFSDEVAFSVFAEALGVMSDRRSVMSDRKSVKSDARVVPSDARFALSEVRTVLSDSQVALTAALAVISEVTAESGVRAISGANAAKFGMSMAKSNEGGFAAMGAGLVVSTPAVGEADAAAIKVVVEDAAIESVVALWALGASPSALLMASPGGSSSTSPSASPGASPSTLLMASPGGSSSTSPSASSGALTGTSLTALPGASLGALSGTSPSTPQGVSSSTSPNISPSASPDTSPSTSSSCTSPDTLSGAPLGAPL